MALDAIGFISGVLGIFSFAESHLPSPGDGTVVRVKAGLQQVDADNTGGTITGVDGYDSLNRYLGSTGRAYIGQGGFHDFTIDQGGNYGVHSAYITLASTGDATCIEWISVTNRDGTAPGAWIGDIGKACGQHWYMGIESVGEDDNGNLVRPACTWLDADHTNKIPSTSMKLSVDAYSGKLSPQTLEDNKQCDGTLFQDDGDEIDGLPNYHPSSKKRSTPRPRPKWMTDQLIISSIAGHNATELCTDPMSWGPDFIDTHGDFCDMDSREVTALCSKQDFDGCLEVAGNSLKKKTSNANIQAAIVKKSYSNVSNWNAK